MTTRSGLPLSSAQAATFRSACTRILGVHGALYLTGTIAGRADTRRVEYPRIRFCLFDGFWKPTAVQAEVAAADIEHVGAILRPLLASLAQSWPSDWVPENLGIMTDGSGIVFCPELPSPNAERWSERLILKDVSTIELLPFAAGSPWSIFNTVVSESHH